MAAAFSIGDLLRRAFGWSFGHLGVLARVAWPAILFALILRLAIGWLWGDEIALVATGQPSGPGLMAGLLSGLVLLLAIALIAVAWHRYVLRGEIVPFPADGATLRFALYEIWLGLLGIAVVTLGLIILSIIIGGFGGPSIIEAFTAGAMQAGGIGWIFAMAALTTVCMTVPFAFYGLILPATAIGDRGLIAAESHRLLRGHRGAVLAALVAIPVLFLVLSYGMTLLIDAVWSADGGFGLGAILVELIQLAITALEVSVFAGVLSEMYRALRLPELARGAAPE